ncbi:MAG: hypothetical protein HYX84_07595 [Chloroflexi bacterium]|nr:hypothetical protein [Chloroflexota bacterium]
MGKKSILIVIFVVCLFAGAGTGYLLAIKKYQPVMENLEIQVSTLTNEVSELEQENTVQKNQTAFLRTERDTLGQKNSILKADLERSERQLISFENRIAGLQSDLSLSQGKLDKILGVTVTQHYGWAYQGWDWNWDLPISLALYFEYLQTERPSLGSTYVELAKDTTDDVYIDKMVEHINNAALQQGFSELQKLDFVIAFVQSLPYTSDDVTTGYDEYPRYPIQTLFDRGGDCEDTSILVAALLDRLGYDVALLLLRNDSHMAVGVSLSTAYGTHYLYEGKKYLYLETTGDGWQVGEFPPDIKDGRAEVYPLRN